MPHFIFQLISFFRHHSIVIIIILLIFIIFCLVFKNTKTFKIIRSVFISITLIYFALFDLLLLSLTGAGGGPERGFAGMAVFYSMLATAPFAVTGVILFFIKPRKHLPNAEQSSAIQVSDELSCPPGKPALFPLRPLIIGTVIAVFPLVWIAAQVVMENLRQVVERKDYKISQELKVKKDKWASYDDRLMPHIIEYVQKHPEKVSYPFSDERVSISGLGDFLSQRVPEVPISGNDILDPWGKQVFVVIDYNGDAMLKCKGLLYGVCSDNLDRLRLGLYSEGMEPFDSPPHDRWQVDGGHMTQAIQLKAAPPTSDFTLNSDDTVTHKTTGLTWKRCAEGMTWTGSTCSGTAKRYTWADAMALCPSGWGMPTIDQLRTIIEMGCNSPYIDKTIFPNTPAPGFWSASAWAGGLDDAWGFDFSDGDPYPDNKSSDYHVRLVRGGQCLGSSSRVRSN